MRQQMSEIRNVTTVSSVFPDMRLLATLLGLVFATTTGACAEDITLNDGTVYKGATILHHDAATATLLYDDGGAAVPMAKLPPDIQKRLDYDPAAAGRQLARDAAADAQAQELATRTRWLDDRACKVWGRIVQVRTDGIVAKIETVDQCAPAAPVVETSAVNTPPTSEQPDVVEVTVVGYRHAKISLGTVFIETGTTGLVDQAHWRGIVWPVGTYGYVTDDGHHVTVPAYTMSPDQAYQALAPSSPAR
jgi:hypothetical protein